MFERIHESSYRAFGDELLEIPAGDLAGRVAAITAITAITDAIAQTTHRLGGPGGSDPRHRPTA